MARFRRAFKRNFKRKPRKQPIWKKMAGIVTNTGLDIASGIRGPIGTVARGLKMVKNLINTEAKFVDTTINLTPDNGTGTITPLCLIAQGTTDQTRIGNSVLSKSLDAHLSILMNASAAATQTRIMLILDKDDSQGTAPTMAQILDTVTETGMMNKDNSDRFVVLYSHRYATELNGRRSYAIDIHKGLANLHIKYDGSAATQANATYNHIYLVMISNEPTNTPTVTGFFRYNYYDN